MRSGFVVLPSMARAAAPGSHALGRPRAMLVISRANKKGQGPQSQMASQCRARSIARASNTVRVHRIPPRVCDDRETPLK